MDNIKALNLAPQTKIASVGFSLIVLVQLIIIVRVIMGSSGNWMVIGPTIISFVVQLFLIIVSLYALNCTVVGKCNLYAWIMGYVVATMGILFVGWICLVLWRGVSQ